MKIELSREESSYAVRIGDKQRGFTTRFHFTPGDPYEEKKALNHAFTFLAGVDTLRSQLIMFLAPNAKHSDKDHVISAFLTALTDSDTHEAHETLRAMEAGLDRIIADNERERDGKIFGLERAMKIFEG